MALHDSNSIARRGEQVEGIAIAFLVLSWFFIALRIWTRTFVISNFGWDDSFMIFAGMVFAVHCSSLLFINAHGGGTHVASVAQLSMLTKWSIVGEVTYVMTVMVLKISLAIFYARLVVQSWHLMLIYITMTFAIVSSVASFFYCILRCGSDLDHYVLRQLANKCTPRRLDQFFAYQQAAFAALSDCVFAILPVFILWNTNMDKRAKVSVGFILSLAALGCICSFIRFQYVDGLTQIDDFFWNAVNVSIWSTIEPGAGIIAGCLATLRPLVRWLFSNARSIKSSIPGSLKEASRYSRSKSNQNSSKPRSVGGSNGDHWPGSHSSRRLNPDIEAQKDEVIELEENVCRKGESTDGTLSISHRSDPAQPGRSLDLARVNSQRPRSRAPSDSYSYDRLLHPLSIITQD